MDEKIDLHIHSTNSDGILTPSQIMQYAFKNNVKLVSITDHDTYKSAQYWDQLSLQGKNIKLIPGIELSTDWYSSNGQRTRIHLLAYDINDDKNELQKELLRMRDAREAGNKAYINKMLKTCGFIDKNIFNDFDYSRYGRIGKLICSQLNVITMSEDEKEEINRFLIETKPQYGKCTINIEDGIEIIKANGGLTSFAHPYQTKLGSSDLDELVGYLKDIGLDAIEVFHGDATNSENGLALFLAEKHMLLKSCGSDFHKQADSHPIGCNTIIKNGESIYTFAAKIKQTSRYCENGKHMER